MVTAKAVGLALIMASASCCNVADTVQVKITQVPTEVMISPSSRTLAEGEIFQFSGVVKDAMGYVIPGLKVTWSSANPSVAAVDESGTVKGLDDGTTQIAGVYGSLGDVAAVTVTESASPPPPANAPELPRLLPDTTMPVLRDTVVVTSNLQAAVDAAKSGTLLLVQGEHVGNFRVQSGAASGVQIQGGRLVTPNTSPAIRFESGVSRWKMVGTEIRSSADHTGALVSIQGGDRITLQHVDVHVHDGATTQRCVLGNGTHISVLNSSLTGCKIKGYDSQAFVAWNGAGPYWLEGNLLEGAGENVMFGGATPSSIDDVPSDITFRNNTVRKPPEWFHSGAWSIKNLFEIKFAIRILIEENIFENSWKDAQDYALNLKNSGTTVGAPTRDVTVRRNTIRNFNIGLWIGGNVDSFLVEGNLFLNGGKDNPYFVDGGARRALGLPGSNSTNITIRHNEWYGTYGNQVTFEGGGKDNFVFQNNIVGEAIYGFQNLTKLDDLAPGAVIHGNIMAPATWNQNLPPGNCVVWPPSSATSCPEAGRR